MGFMLLGNAAGEPIYNVNFWNWRAIVEAIRRLEVLPESRVDGLHEQYQGTGLTHEECIIVAEAIRTRLIPTIDSKQRLLIDGHLTTEPDDGTMHYDPAEQDKNYSTRREVLEEFVAYCESSGGFAVC